MGDDVAVLVVDDDPFVRAALRALLEAADGVRCCGEAHDGSHIEAAVAQCGPEVVLLDLEMPGVDGVTATRRLHRARPDLPVIVLTNHLADAHVLGALRAGASGYLLKNSGPQEIAGAIAGAAAGELVLSAGVTKHLVDAFVDVGGRPRASHAWAAALTDREREVAEAVGQGLSNQHIADQLFMSLSTVKSNVSRILAKLALDNRVQLALVVHGLLAEPGTSADEDRQRTDSSPGGADGLGRRDRPRW